MAPRTLFALLFLTLVSLTLAPAQQPPGGGGPGASPGAFPSRGDRGDRGPGGGFAMPGGGFGGAMGGGGGAGGFDADAMAERVFRGLDKDGDGLLKIDDLGDRFETLANE